ncbi:unnamed protein product [Boreogadus saida]
MAGCLEVGMHQILTLPQTAIKTKDKSREMLKLGQGREAGGQFPTDTPQPCEETTSRIREARTPSVLDKTMQAPIHESSFRGSGARRGHPYPDKPPIWNQQLEKNYEA